MNYSISKPVKPLLRGWSHALAAVASLIVTIILCWLSREDLARMISMLVFGLSMIELYTISAIYHIVTWTPERRRFWRALDHANIFVLIAGTYTPLCFNILSGWVRPALLISIWVLATLGVCLAVFTLHLPRWVTALLYVCMGWEVVFALPAFLAVLPWVAVGILLLGGVLYTLGAIIYAIKKPNPFPRVWGYHEIFHLFVIAGSVAFTACVWIWALPFPRV
ncbi:hemolysin III [Thermosporothrix hazakensis]|jgi:hemolysin III|uniref:Hemolysin III n=1 Tax=Thermosporothrix hazakensis TaxID=644383 RepID=A0A326UDQ1_THEHA|nr:hemolysin III family protein [Thermosporothrix hazakensis]PZW27895.1 hemolysin III [Thermosporothrix hazakensis]GCE51120.1 channel protein, hemolysin III family [Thermosporothrix hazakensis]